MPYGLFRVQVESDDDTTSSDFETHSEAVDKFQSERERVKGLLDSNELDSGCVELSFVLDQFDGED